MTEERSTFETTRARLEDIVTQVRRKDVSLEQSLDMLEEAVRLVNVCNDQIDQTSWKAPAEGAPGAGDVANALEDVEALAEADDRDEELAEAAIELEAVVEIVVVDDMAGDDTGMDDDAPGEDFDDDERE